MKQHHTPTESEIRAEINREFDRWNDIAAHGCADPYWEDGVNMNLVRNHILYGYNVLAERGFTTRTLFGEFPEERPVPPKVDTRYTVRGECAERLKRTRTPKELDRIVWGYSGQYRA